MEDNRSHERILKYKPKGERALGGDQKEDGEIVLGKLPETKNKWKDVVEMSAVTKNSQRMTRKLDNYLLLLFTVALRNSSAVQIALSAGK